jgi:RNA polymerase sigma factor (sigma-70 family)
MARGSTHDVLKHLTTLCRSGVLGNLNDEQLLERFTDLSDDSAHEAFETIVRRHGPMVFGVCVRVLRDMHEAEDAFQATFLILARKATSVIPREKVANWLYGVACHTAHEARVRAARRRAREERVARGLHIHTPDEALHNELRAILDDELSRLPARYRAPIILCELEGLTRQEAAGRLGVPEGTVSSRLARAKARLRDRLARRGLALPAGAVSLLAIREASATMLKDSLITSTTVAAMRVAAGIRAAAVFSTTVVSLAEGVLKTMLLTKLKGIAIVLGSSIAVISGAAALGQTGPFDRTSRQPDAERMTVMERKLDRIIDALDRLAGTTATHGSLGLPGGPGGHGALGLPGGPGGHGKAETKPAPGPDPVREENPLSAQFYPRAKGAVPATRADLPHRLEAVERDLQNVQQALAQLTDRVSELENAGRGRQPGHESRK